MKSNDLAESNLRTVRDNIIMIVYLLAIVSVAFTAARIGLSHHYGAVTADGISESDAAKAIYFDATNPAVFKARGIDALRRHRFDEAAADLQSAAKLSEHDPVLWVHLGDALTGMKDFDAARQAYQTAISLAPSYAKPEWNMGLMLLAAGARDEAFVHLGKSAARDASLYPELLELARKEYSGDQAAMEQALNPTTKKARIEVARYMIELGLMTDAIMVLLTGNDLTDEEKNDFVHRLIVKKDLPAAYATWLSKTGTAPAKPTDDHPLFDGGFEITTASDPSGFGWHIDHTLSNAAVAIDTGSFFSGSRSLHIKFGGNVEPQRNIVSQMLMVKPFRNYKLTFAVRSHELTSGGLPMIVVDTGKSEARSAPIKATDNKWVMLKVDFSTNERSTVTVALRRAGCEVSSCPIFGEMSLDDMSIEAVRPTS